MENLIKDNGKIRCCPNNKAKLGYVKSFFEFYGYKKTASRFPAQELVEAFALIFQVILFIILFPVIPFIECYTEVRKAKKDVARDKKNR